MTKSVKTFGTWTSPLTPKSLASGVRLEAPRFDSEGRTVVWLEGRSGRGVLVACDLESGNAPRDLTSDLSVRAEVGYGGGDFAVHGGNVYFAVHKQGRIYRQPIAAGTASPVTPAGGKAASPTPSPCGRWVAYVHHDEDDIDRLAVVDVQGSHWPQILTSGADFYMQPRFSPDGSLFAWIEWDHPNMPWDGTRLCIANIEEHPEGLLPYLTNVRTIAGGEDVAVFQPEFTPDGKLLYVSDETGWSRLAIHDLQTDDRRWLSPAGVECGLPAWMQDRRTYAVSGDGEFIVAAFNENAHHRLTRIEIETGECHALEMLTAYTATEHVTSSPTTEHIAFWGSGARQPTRLVVYDCQARRTRVVARSSGETISDLSFSDAQPISWPTTDGETAHGLFFPPASENFESPGAPPLVVWVHGGPTGQVLAGWRGEIQFLATRGYAVLAVNYRGSTGHGREYMLRLRTHWGICDVEDSISGVNYLAEQGRIDPSRTVVMGGSAGGFTVLQTMAHRPDAFTAGICLFGVADQFHLASMTHKFESRYLDTMLGPLPDAAEIYRQRSPVNFAERITRPLAIFQGEIDQVVPQEQSDMIADALQRSGTPHEYHVYEGEGHGWRKSETIEHYFTAVEKFLLKHVIYA